jgi:hypothetical protein
MNSDKPILVTGSPRAGTSWVGRMLSQAPLIRYIHEPFNIRSRPCYCGVKFDYWFLYLTPDNSRPFHSHLKHTFFPSFNRIGLFNLITTIAQTRRIRPIIGYLQAYLPYRPLVKDPLAVFSAKRLADLFNMDVVVLIRHPAAIVSSYKTLKWTHPFSHFLHQPELMEEHLAPFQVEIEDFAKNEYDAVDQAALLWKLIHYMIIKYQEKHPDWIFVRHEDLASEPIENYQKLFNRLKLPFSEHVREVIQEHSFQAQLSDTTRPYMIKQNSFKAISKWKKYLTPTDITRIRKRVEEVSSHFFSREEWYIFLIACTLLQEILSLGYV